MKKIFALTAISVALLGAGCSSDDDDDGGTTGTTDATTGTTDGTTGTTGTTDGTTGTTDGTTGTTDGTTGVPAAVIGEGDSVADAIGADTELSSLLAAMPQDVQDVLDDEGNTATYTVFAPNNAAFTAAEATTSTLAEDQIRTVLLGHVLNGTVGSADIDGILDQPQTTLAGQDITVAAGAAAADGSSTFTVTSSSGNVATIVTTDIEAANGVVHVIDAVLVPADTTGTPTLTPATGGETGGDTGEGDGTGTGDGTDTGTGTGGGGDTANSGAISSGEYSNFATASTTLFGSLDAFDDAANNSWTVFVPNDTVATDAAAINVRAHIYTDMGLDPTALAAASTLTVSTDAGNNDYQVGTDGAGNTTVDGNAVTPLSNNGSTYVYSIDGVLGN